MSDISATDTVKNFFPDNPFPGLRPFRTSEAHLFFGRRKQSDEILQKLLSNRFCAVTGASGSGKSSLIYCGLIPTLQNIHKGTPGEWITVITRPGNAPLAALMEKFGFTEGFHSKELMKNPDYLSLILKNKFPGGTNRILIILDQFEEVFRFSDNNKREDIDSPLLFTKVITGLVKQSIIPVYLIVTMRSDFIGECSKFPELTAMINSSNYLVPRMSLPDFREVIEGPVKVVGMRISPNLVESMLEDLGDNPDQLPVLQHALMRTWNYWIMHSDPERPIARSDYEAIGKIGKALSEHANEAYGELNEREKELCEKVFRTITEKGTDNKGLRKPARFGRLMEITQAERSDLKTVLDTFRSHGRSFITPSVETSLTDNTVVDISHESFMRIWDRLRIWVDEEAVSVQMYKRLAESALQYQKGRSGLWRPPDLQLALNWQKKNNPTQAWAERYNPAFERTMAFLATSQSVFRKEEENKIWIQKRQLRRTRYFAIVLGSVAIFSMGLYIWTRVLRVKAETEFQRAETQRQLAELKSLEALQQSEMAELAAREAREQRSLAEDQSKIADEQRLEAEKMAIEANRQASRATLNFSEANRQRSLALVSEKEAQEQRRQAELAREEAFQRRMLAVARSLAVKSIQVIADPELKALLAFQAYLFNKRFEGPHNDEHIYTGLYQALKLSLGNTYNVYIGHQDAVRSVKFVPGTQDFISAGSDGKILKWEISDTLKRSLTISEGRGHIETIEISPDGKWLLCAENQAGMLLFDNEKLSQPPVVLSGLNNSIHSVAISPDSKSFFSTGSSNVIEYWNLSGGTNMRFADHQDRINSLSLSPDGVLLAGGTRDGKLIVWRTKGETVSSEVYSDPLNSIQCVAYAPDYRYLASGNIKGEILIFRADNFKLIKVISGHSARITELSFSPDGKILASSSYDGTILCWNMEDLTSPPVVLNDHDGFAFTVAFSSDGKHFVSGSAEGNRLILRPAYSNSLAEQICKQVKRNLTPEEWNTYVGSDIPHEETCPNSDRLLMDSKQ